MLCSLLSSVATKKSDSSSIMVNSFALNLLEYLFYFFIYFYFWSFEVLRGVSEYDSIFSLLILLGT